MFLLMTPGRCLSIYLCQAIQQMEEDVQRAVMAAIQALPGFQDSSGGSLIANPKQRNAATLDFDNLLAQLEAAHEENKLLARQCSQLTSQVLLIFLSLLFSSCFYFFYFALLRTR